MGDNTKFDESDVDDMKQRILDNEDITHRNRKQLLRYHMRMSLQRLSGDIGPGAQRSNTRLLMEIAEEGFNFQSLLVPLEAYEAHGITDEQRRAEKEAKRISEWINARDFSKATRDAYARKVHTFVNTFASYHRIPRGDDYLKMNRYQPKDAVPDPDELLLYEEHVLPCILSKREDNLRDPALIALQWGCGGRPESEVNELTMNNIEVRDNCIVLDIPNSSKTGTRKVNVYVGVQFVKDWLHEHPTADMHENSDTPLWVTIQHKTNKLSYDRQKEIFTQLADQVGLDRRTNPRMFRKSRASIAAYREGMSEDDLREIFGWTRRSEAPGHYIAKYGAQASDKLAELEGANVEDASREKEISPVRCPSDTCGRYTPRFLDKCFYCGTSIDPEAGTSAEDAAIELDTEASELWTQLVQMATSGQLDLEDAELAEMVSKIAEQHPGMVGDLTDLIEAFDTSEN